jgi:hypothetical protein
MVIAFESCYLSLYLIVIEGNTLVNLAVVSDCRYGLVRPFRFYVPVDETMVSMSILAIFVMRHDMAEGLKVEPVERKY